MALILFALVQSRNEVHKPVAWIFFEIRFTLMCFWKYLKNSTKNLKVALNMKKKQKKLLMLFYRLFDCHKVNFGPLSTFAPWKGWRGTWKMHFLVKIFLWAILIPKMMASLKSGCNISIRASVHLCKFVRNHRVFRNIPDTSFTFTERLLGKMLLPSESILHGLASISIDCCFFVTWLHFQ